MRWPRPGGAGGPHQRAGPPPVPVALILDDADALTTPPLLDALQTLVRYAPPAHRLILAGRGAPALPFATLAARGQPTSIGEPEPGFAADEARHYFEGFGGPLAESAVADAVAHHRGWAAGMYLVALSVRGADDADALMAGIRRRAGRASGRISPRTSSPGSTRPGWISSSPLVRSTASARTCAPR